MRMSLSFDVVAVMLGMHAIRRLIKQARCEHAVFVRRNCRKNNLISK